MWPGGAREREWSACGTTIPTTDIDAGIKAYRMAPLHLTLNPIIVEALLGFAESIDRLHAEGGREQVVALAEAM
jgi:hypothetical protein